MITNLLDCTMTSMKNVDGSYQFYVYDSMCGIAYVCSAYVLLSAFLTKVDRIIMR